MEPSADSGDRSDLARTWDRLVVRAIPRHVRRVADAWKALMRFYSWPGVAPRPFALDTQGAQEPTLVARALLGLTGAGLFAAGLPAVATMWACWLLTIFAGVFLMAVPCLGPAEPGDTEQRSDLATFFAAALEFPGALPVFCGATRVACPRAPPACHWLCLRVWGLGSQRTRRRTMPSRA